MLDPLKCFWPGVEAVTPTFTRAAIIRWPETSFDQLVDAGLLVPDQNPSRILCPECGKLHCAKPIVRKQSDGSVKMFIPCSEHLRAEVRTRDLQQWSANVESLVKCIAVSLNTRGQIKDLASGRVWRCGRWTHKGVARDVLFARGLRRKDAQQFRRAVTQCHAPVVFVGSEVPDSEFWSVNTPAMIRLADVALLNNGKLVVEMNQVSALINAADVVRQDEIASSKSKENKAMRRAIKEEIRSSLTDEQISRAYVAFGTYEKTAKALSTNGHTFNRWAVEHAVKRSGGREVVLEKYR